MAAAPALLVFDDLDAEKYGDPLASHFLDHMVGLRMGAGGNTGSGNGNDTACYPCGPGSGVHDEPVPLDACAPGTTPSFPQHNTRAEGSIMTASNFDSAAATMTPDAVSDVTSPMDELDVATALRGYLDTMDSGRSAASVLDGCDRGPGRPPDTGTHSSTWAPEDHTLKTEDVHPVQIESDFSTNMHKPTTKTKPRARPKGDLVASRFCHVCGRKRGNGPGRAAVCGRIKTRECRKTVCAHCLGKRAVEWGIEALVLNGAHLAVSEVGDEWECPHCRRLCGDKAQCATYRKTNWRRHVLLMKRKAREREMQERGESASVPPKLESRLVDCSEDGQDA